MPKVSDRLHSKLLIQGSRSYTFLSNLTKVVPLPNNRVQKPAMPSTAFKGAKALAFAIRSKHGLLGSYQREMGFITKKIVNPDGSITWSAPLFMHSRYFGVGATAGYFRGGFCAAILDDTALEFCLKKKGILFNAKANFLVDMNGARMRPVHLDSSKVENVVASDARSGTRANYFRAHAMMVDWSLNWGFMGVWASRNREVYGNATCEDVLSGRVPRPVEFDQVFKEIQRLTEEAMVVAPKAGAITGRSRSGHFKDLSGRGRTAAASALQEAQEPDPSGSHHTVTTVLPA